jgi:hypothetical protein
LARRGLTSRLSDAHLFAGGLAAAFGQTGLLPPIAIMLGRRRLRCAYGVRRREALFETFLKLIVRCFIRFGRFFRVRSVLIEWRWIEFVAPRSLPSNDQSFARMAVPFPRTFCWQVLAARTHQKRTRAIKGDVLSRETMATLSSVTIENLICRDADPEVFQMPASCVGLLNLCVSDVEQRVKVLLATLRCA